MRVSIHRKGRDINNLEHMYSRNYQAIKNHYYLIQIGHMILQVMEAWEKLWKGIRQSREQKHRRLLELFKETRLKEIIKHLKRDFRYDLYRRKR